MLLAQSRETAFCPVCTIRYVLLPLGVAYLPPQHRNLAKPTGSRVVLSRFNPRKDTPAFAHGILAVTSNSSLKHALHRLPREQKRISPGTEIRKPATISPHHPSATKPEPTLESCLVQSRNTAVGHCNRHHFQH